MMSWHSIVKSWRRVMLFILLIALCGCIPKEVAFGATPEPAVIRFASRRSAAAFRTLINEFQAKYPNIQIKFVELQRQPPQQVDFLFQEGQIDVLLDDRRALGYIQKGLLKPLDDLMIDEWIAIRDDYFKGTWESLSLEGRQWGIPAGLDLNVIYVNMDHLKALKLPVPDASKWTLNDFLQLAIKMNYPEGLPYAEQVKLLGYCTTPENPIDLIAFIYLHGGKIVDNIESPTQATLNNPLTIEAVQWYADLFTRHRVSMPPDTMRASFRGGVYEASVRGRCGVWMGWYSARGGLDTQYKWNIEWKMLPMPRDRVEFGIGDIDAYYLSKSCTHPREALRFVRFLADRFESSGQKLPPRRSLVSSSAYARAVGESVANVAKTFSDKVLIVPTTVAPGLEKVGASLIAALNRVILEGQSVPAALADAQKECQAVFQKL